MRLHIFNSKRKLKEYFNECKNSNSLLDSAMSVEDFLENICLVKARKANKYETLLLMQKACKQSKNLEKELGISNEFFFFLKNNHYLFSFFRELAFEKKTIDELKNNDYYASYNEHLEILDEVFHTYLLLLQQENLYDDISLPSQYVLDEDFLETFDEIVYELEGFLSKFEEDLLAQLAQKKQVFLHCKTSHFTLDILSKLDILETVILKANREYKINISTKQILEEKAFEAKNRKCKVKKFELRSLQFCFAKDEISKYIRAGMKPENIVLITPDEKFCELLRLYDKDKMFNFANGISIKESGFYQKLLALYESANEQEFHFDERSDYFEDSTMKFEYYNTLLHSLKLDFKTFKMHFDKPYEEEYFNTLVYVFLQDEQKKFYYKELLYLIETELFFLKDLLKKHILTLKEVLELFFLQIATLRLSNVDGGKVTAMGILESRGLCFDGVVILDFNDNVIPKRSVNELFLNNEIRKKAGLISYEKRENLQRFYYESLMKNAQKVSICCVENEHNFATRFLNELDFEFVEETEIQAKSYLNAFKLGYEGIKPNLEPLEPPTLKYNLFSSPLSFSRFNLFLKKKRTYYYQYILKLKEPRPFNDEKQATHLGIFIHKILELHYKQNPNNFDTAVFLKLLEQENKKNLLSPFEIEILKLRFVQFAENEKKYFSQGFRVKEVECSVTKDFFLTDTKSVCISGKIDRIDECNGKNLILDYKSGEIEDNSYQLAFYQALYDEKAQAFFYDMKKSLDRTNGKNPKSLEDLKEQLIEFMEEKVYIFENGNKKDFCPYRLLYEKDLK
ncbi:PD-(D/E)XK nuclease family protein [Campylobacter sp. MIT 21-1685]|uniref:PD-(D/E)XK nuclease family protein n=1 Tax=unclassified Campylobacter TaxID=2593542 RepID=UPI00224B84C2|nr:MULTISPECIES: PD-(D/E)XK nuclease family protein [unclassified Campylobacter]MCX2683574.1 PD-(D/E)XK nuclease family protein [Campylobacter sp. MIT 21-1684]MCX2751831.1 PD-(D/E)XK nuclease family protein [Campylobacter sp. MIT 21-1682]MCX2808058.1 PD-(D/E)XK nuclease family protein [Campylobacter sp. MIT 21-1685]